jgi:hypothetical protein
MVINVCAYMYRHPSSEKVKGITSPKRLLWLAKNASDSDVGKAAAEKLSDHAVLADVAKNASAESVRSAAVRKLSHLS